MTSIISREIRVSCIWSSLNEDVVVDSEVYTDLDPIQAPVWVAQLELNDAVPSLMMQSVTSFVNSCRSKQTTEQLLGKNYTVLQSPGSVLLLSIVANVPIEQSNLNGSQCPSEWMDG